jgi:excisionase family DNA binding protein
MVDPKATVLTIAEAGEALGVSRATIWRMIRRGELPTVRQRGRRLVPKSAVRHPSRTGRERGVPPFRPDHPIFRLIGAGRSGGAPPGARDKHAILER